MLLAILQSIALPLLKGMGVGVSALLLFFLGKGKGEDKVIIKQQEKEIKDAKVSQTLKDRISNKSRADLVKQLSSD